MQENTAVKILKGAVLLEIRGKAFYEKVAQESRNSAVKEFFGKMAREEENHIQTLTRQFNAYTAKKKFARQEFSEDSAPEGGSKILTDKLKDQISAAGFEASAIAAAMAMEKDAIRYYSERADATEDSNEKILYQWLADWERNHLNMLADIDKALTERFWVDNQFWPF